MDVLVDEARLAAGDFPAICVVTGQPADLMATVTYTKYRGAKWRIIEHTVGLPFFAAFTSSNPRERSGLVPVASGIVERVRRRRWARTALGCAIAVVGSITGLALLLMTAPVWAAVCVAVSLLVGILTGLTGFEGFIDVLPADGQTWLLRGVHPDFAAGLQSPTHD